VGVPNFLMGFRLLGPADPWRNDEPLFGGSVFAILEG